MAVHYNRCLFCQSTHSEPLCSEFGVGWRTAALKYNSIAVLPLSSLPLPWNPYRDIFLQIWNIRKYGRVLAAILLEQFQQYEPGGDEHLLTVCSDSTCWWENGIPHNAGRQKDKTLGRMGNSYITALAKCRCGRAHDTPEIAFKTSYVWKVLVIYGQGWFCEKVSRARNATVESHRLTKGMLCELAFTRFCA